MMIIFGWSIIVTFFVSMNDNLKVTGSVPLFSSCSRAFVPRTTFYKSLWTKASAKRLLAYKSIVSLYASCHGQFTALVEFLSQICSPHMLRVERDQYGPQGNIPGVVVLLSPRYLCPGNHLRTTLPEKGGDVS